jgi:hypothetical protein
MDADGMPPWIECSASCGDKVVFRWTLAGRARHAGYSPALYAHFPAVVISGSVYRSEADCAAWADAGHIGDATFFADWPEALAWLGDPDGDWESVDDRWADDEGEIDGE